MWHVTYQMSVPFSHASTAQNITRLYLQDKGLAWVGLGGEKKKARSNSNKLSLVLFFVFLPDACMLFP